MDVIGSGVHLDGALLNVRLRGQLSFPIADELQRRSIPFVFVTGSDPTVTKHYPGVPVHPKPADMADIVFQPGTPHRRARPWIHQPRHKGPWPIVNI